MVYKTLENLNASQGPHLIFVYINDVTSGLFSAMVLFSLFVVIALASFFSQKRLTGKADFPASMAVAGFVTSGAGFLMLLIDGLINPYAVVVTVVVTIISVLWLLLSKNN